MYQYEIPPLGDSRLRRHVRGPRVRRHTDQPTPGPTGTATPSNGSTPSTPTPTPSPSAQAQATDPSKDNGHDGSGKNNDYGHHLPKKPGLTNKAPLPTKGHGEVNVAQTKLNSIASAVKDELDRLTPAINLVQQNGGMAGANFGTSQTAIDYKNLASYNHTAFTTYLADVTTAFNDLISAIQTAGKKYQSADDASTLPNSGGTNPLSA